MLIDNMRAVNIQEESDTGMCEISASRKFSKDYLVAASLANSSTSLFNVSCE